MRPETPRKTTEIELDILRAMCSGTAEGRIQADGLKILAKYQFQDEVHQLVFNTLREISTDEPRVIREQLPARLNNKGFPALDLETFFQPHSLTAAQAVRLMCSLRDAPSSDV